MREGLVDPESARFQDEKYLGALPHVRMYEVTVNSKNRMGGYSGRRKMMCSFLTSTGKLERAPVELAPGR